MSQRIILLTPRRRFLANRFGLGYQLPLGLVFLGGPLVDAGHVVRLIDNDLYGWDTPRLVAEVTRFRTDIVLLGHTGSTAAHPACIATARALKDALPHLRIGYGGVYPSYSAEAVLRDCPALDVIVRGEGEAAAKDLARAWEEGRSLAEVEGITWRDGEAIRTNRPRPSIRNLDCLVNLIYGLEEETFATHAARLRRLFALDPDILNAVYRTAHHWTAAGRATDPRDVSSRTWGSGPTATRSSPRPTWPRGSSSAL